MGSEPEIAWNIGAELGEGPVWVERDQAVWFVDIKKPAIHRFAPGDGATRSWDAPALVGFLVPSDDGKFIAGLQTGLFHFDPASGAFDPIVEVDSPVPDDRLNDGVVDCHGRLWFGTMDTAEKEKCGAFYCFADGELAPTAITNVRVTNGPAVSPDGRLLYAVDTLRGAIECADIHDDGTLGPLRRFVKIAPTDGFPDGPTVDSEGCVWIGLYGGWEARRYSTGGELLDRVRFPVANITKLALGGDDLRTVYATTARQGLTSEQLEKQPHAGNLFQFRTDVPGLASPLVRMTGARP
jgi:sugar lactone lactonase YvrE